MSSSFVTRIEQEKDEPYTVIFTTDDHDKYRHIEDECRKMIGHAKPTVDAVPVVRCRDCKHSGKIYSTGGYIDCAYTQRLHEPYFYCADGERKGGDE